MSEAKGIDLGTTNSSVAVLRGMTPVVYTNNDNLPWTPSAVWIDRSGHVHVGRLAKQRAEADPENVAMEFKRNMGKVYAYHFKDSARAMQPEELSAEVLKSLRQTVERQGDTLEAAAIGVPADFDLDACQATATAATAAGFRKCHHVQEPVAAALAYGFDRLEDNVTWVVYDLGGGTFDAALVTLHDGEIRVLSYNGAKFLGGKDIDWDIVDRILVPDLLKRGYKLSDFRRGKDYPQWLAAFAKLKGEAEDAKILLSETESVPINIDSLCRDDRGDWVAFDFELSRAAIEPLIEPYARRSIELVKELLATEGLGPGDIAKMILVGGPTKTPLVRMLVRDLGIELECGVDPLTVVAQGAAIFAAGLVDLDVGRSPEAIQTVPLAGTYTLRTDFRPMDQDETPDFIGRVETPDGKVPPEQLTIEVVEESAGWRSGRQPLNKGKFHTRLRAERGRENRFRIELCDSTGSAREVFPSMVTYRVANRPGEQILIHSLGVALQDNQAMVLTARNTPLSQAKATETFISTVRLLPGEAGAFLRIPLIEGEARLADRNRLIGALVVRADEIERELPLGSDVEVTIEVDQSRQVNARAYVPLLDRWFEKVVCLGCELISVEDLTDRHREETDRLKNITQRVKKAGHADAKAKAEDAREDLAEVERSLPAVLGASDATSKCHERLLKASIALDEAEGFIRTTEAVAELREHLSQARQLAVVAEDERTRLATLEREVEAAVASGDHEVIANCQQAVIAFIVSMLGAVPEFWLAWLDTLAARRQEMTDQNLAERLLAEGRKCGAARDAAGLEATCRQLASLLPDPPPPPLPDEWVTHIDRKLF